MAVAQRVLTAAVTKTAATRHKAAMALSRYLHPSPACCSWYRRHSTIHSMCQQATCDDGSTETRACMVKMCTESPPPPAPPPPGTSNYLKGHAEAKCLCQDRIVSTQIGIFGTTAVQDVALAPKHASGRQLDHALQTALPSHATAMSSRASSIAM